MRCFGAECSTESLLTVGKGFMRIALLKSKTSSVPSAVTKKASPDKICPLGLLLAIPSNLVDAIPTPPNKL